MSDPTRVLIIHPTDLTRPKVGGIHSFLDAFVALAPDDFAVEHVGIGVGDGVQVGSWTDVASGGRAFRFLPALVSEDAERRSRVPLGARFALALARLRGRIGTAGRVLQFHRPGLAVPYLRSGTARVQVIHLSSEQLLSRGSESRWRRLGGALRLVEDRVLPRMDAIYAISEEVTEAYRSRYPRLAGRIGFLSNWVDERFFFEPSPAVREAARAELRAALRADDGDLLVLAVGRLERQKRPELAVEALARLEDRRVRLGWIGAGSLERMVRELAGRAGVGDRLTILPPRPREALARALAGADALLITSGHETGPTVAFEALATGLPLASTRVGRVPALVGNAPAGRLAREASPQAVADALAAVLSGDESQRRRAAVDAAMPYRASVILEPFYDAHRRLAARGSG
jgi:glycosyltransferase involved in cell wall biosynthesis